MARPPKPPAIRLAPKESDMPRQSAEEHASSFLEMNRRASPLTTIENMQKLLNLHGITCQFNQMAKREEIIIPGEAQAGEDIKYSYARLYSRMEEVGLSTRHADEYVAYLASKNPYNPAKDWVLSKPWDGKSRKRVFYDTLQTKHPEYRDAILYRWLLTGIAMLMEADGIDSAGCFVLQGDQNLGKTWWARKLVDDKYRKQFVADSRHLDPSDPDSLLQLIRFWIGELGEINSTFARADMNRLKAFLTADQDILRIKYDRRESVFPRRTLMCASVNENFYLLDDTGNRRFWTLPVTKVNSYHTIDMQQLWAEIYIDYKNGVSWRPTPAECLMIDTINAGHLLVHPLNERIIRYYDWACPTGWSYKSATEIARELGYNAPTQKETRPISNIMRNLTKNLPDGTKKQAGIDLYLVPNVKL